MTPVINISSAADPRLTPYRELKDKRLFKEFGLFIAEGEFLVQRLLDSSFSIHSVLMTPSRWAKGNWNITENVPVYLASKDVLSAIVGFPFHRGVLALAKRPSLPTVQETSFLNVNRLVILPEINNVENLGVVVRTAAGLRYSHILLGKSCCDPFARRAIRTSMGAAFLMNFVISSQLPDDLIELQQKHHFEWHAITIAENAVPLHHIQPPKRTGLLFGTEADGLSRNWLQLCDKTVAIPMAPQIDSLNVAVAAGIVLYHYCDK